MKNMILMMAALISSLAHANDLSCTSRSMIGEEFVKVDVSVKDTSFHISRVATGSLVESKSISIDGKSIASCIKLGKKRSFTCVKELIPLAKDKNDSVKSLNNMLVHIDLVRNITDDDISDFIDMPSENDFDISNVASGSINVFQHNGEFPAHGTYEYMDAEGKLLARFYFKYFPSLCK